MAQDTPEKSILEKLALTQTFHPAGAKLFVPDWTLDPGDVVTVTSKKDVHDPDEEPTEYKVPIYSMDLTWNGTSRLDIQSTGNQEREPLSALRRKEYQTGRRGYGMAKELDDSFKEFETWQTQTDEVIGTYAAQFVDILGDGTNEGRLTLAETAIEQTASDATITAQAAGILLDEDGHPVLDERGKYQYDPNAANTTLTARINTNATNITTEVTRLDGEDSRLSGLIQTEAGKISQIVSAVGQNGEVTAGSIILAINKSKDGSATSTTTITADAINLEGYVTASYVDATILTVNQLTSDSGYIGNIKASNINTGGNVVASGAVIGSGLYIGTSAPYTDVSTAVAAIRKKTTGLADGEIGFEYHTLGSSTWSSVNFNIADTAFYKKRVGISSVNPGNWQYDSTEHKYYNPVVATAKDSTQEKQDTVTANVFIPDITLTPVVNGLTYVGKVNAWGPSVSGTVYAAADELSLYLKEKDNYVYITKTDSDPVTVGPNSNVVARMEIQGGGSEEDYAAGYTDGQENVNGLIETITHPSGDTNYLANILNIDVTATPQLELKSNDTPPIISYITGRTNPGRVTPLTDTIQLPVVVTPATLSEGAYTNGQYTITGTGGNVNVDGSGGTNIPVGVTPLTFTPTDALNSVNVIKGSWTGTTTRTIEFTTDAPSPNASAPKSVTLSWNNGDWVWTASDDSGNYQKQIQVKDGSSVAMTDYVDLPDTKVVVTSPGQQQASWWKRTGSNAYKYVVPASTAADYLSSDSSNQHVLANGTGEQTIIDPSEAILHGKSQVSVTRTWDEYTGSTTGATPLESGKTYQLQVKKDGTNVYDELYSVPAQATPTVNSWSLTHQTGTDYTYNASVKVNGTTYTSESLNATEAYNNGWTGAYQSVGIFPTAVADLVPGGSPITIYAQAKATSGSAKSNVASVQVKARALNLKNETFSTNNTYTVPSGYDGYGTITVDVQGGGGDYYSTFLDKITLSNEDIGDSVQKYSVANYSDGHRDSEAKTRVVIDASAVYSAGVTAGLGGVVNVEKQPWDGNTCEFKPSAGEGTSASVTITAEPTKVSLASATSTGEIVLKDGSNQFATKNLYLRSRTLNGQNYVVLTDTSSIVSVGNVLAKYSASGGGTGETRSVYNISDIVLSPEDIGPSVVKYPTLYYDDETDDNTIPIYIDASAVYRRGQQDGAGISILDNYSTTIDSNNTTVTLLPSEKGDYNVMASASVRVSVPPVYRIAQNLAQTIVLPATHTGIATINNNQVKYDLGPDTGNFPVVIDASAVFNAGVSEGAGVQIEQTKSYGSTVTETGTYTINPSSGYAAMKKATFSVRVPTVPRIQQTLAYGTASIGTHTVYPDEDYDAMQKVTFTVPNVTVDTQRNQPTTGVTTTNIRVGNNIKVIVKFGNATIHQQIFAATN